MARSTFDANSFMEQNFKTELDVRLTPVPEGEYIAQIIDVKLREVQFRKIEGTGVGIDITWEITDDNVRRAMNMEHPQARQSFLLDLDADGRLDLGKNKNVRLGRVLSATGLNSKRGWSLPMLKFQTAFIKVEQRADDDDPEIVYSDVKRVAPLDKARAASAA